MPELPDLQVFSSNLEKLLKGRTIKKINVPVSKKLNVSIPALKKTLVGKSIERVTRDGKELHIKFNGGDVLSLHMMLHGNLRMFEKKNEEQHTVLEIYFDNDKGLALTDWQKNATPTLNPEPKEGVDALSKENNYKFLKEALQSKAVIKKLLMNQHLIRGIGNAYSDEILWDAGIHPFSVSNKIPDIKIRALAKSIKKVLGNAEKQIKKSHPDIIAGEVRDFLMIHNPKKEKSPTGGKIIVGELGSRVTYYSEEQELFK